MGRAGLRRDLGRPDARPRLKADLQNVHAPLLLVYGTEDPRVPRTQSERELDALLAR